MSDPSSAIRHPSSESGSIFLMILIGVVLFAALAFTLTRSMRSQTTSSLTGRQAEIAASDILTYAQRVQNAVERVRRHNCSENDISFENDVVAGYTHAVAPPDRCKIFHAQGGALGWQDPPAGVNDGSAWFFSDNNRFTGHGDDAINDLALFLPNLDYGVCMALNEGLGIDLAADPPVSADAPDVTTKATGLFTASTTDIGPGTAGFSAFPSGCFSNGGAYYFFNVLMAR
ncbi:MAG: hypothetical protein L6Q57_04135 [Alphaproteobacteria bacterium]|nr:hypothetical protein [Alphaproteobacteria bacterium]